MNIYRHNQPFELERGGILPELTIAFSTYGKLNAAHDNVIWVCHALTADSDVASVAAHGRSGQIPRPAEHFIICANILGSHYGTTGPLHVNPATGRPYYKDFPELTIRDMVRAHRLLADILASTASTPWSAAPSAAFRRSNGPSRSPNGSASWS